MNRYQDIYPSEPSITSSDLTNTMVSDLITLEYFEAEPNTMPTQVFDQHHILINLNPVPHRVENWRNGEHRDFTYLQNQIIVTPAGIESGWRWHAQSKVIVITLEPKVFEQFAINQVGVLLDAQQLADIPIFLDTDICQSAHNLYLALQEKSLGYEVMFESLARVFLVKLIQKYALTDHSNELASLEKTGLTANKYKQVLSYVKQHFAESISVSELADTVAMSPQHFSKVFKNTLGRTPIQYVQEHRVEESKRLLGQSDLSLVEVAERCGFSDQAHFSRLFKKYTAQTPKRYRDRLVSTVI